MAEKKNKIIRLENVILSYPNLFAKAQFEGKELKYDASFILKKDSANYQKLKAEYDRVVAEAIATKALTRGQITPWDRRAGEKGIVLDCADDPEKYDDPRYENAVIITAKNTRRPSVVNRLREPIEEKDNAIYGGCICNASLSLYIYNKTFKGIGIQLNGVQKVSDGEAFGATPPSIEEMFDEIDEATMYD